MYVPILINTRDTVICNNEIIINDEERSRPGFICYIFVLVDELMKNENNYPCRMHLHSSFNRKGFQYREIIRKSRVQ